MLLRGKYLVAVVHSQDVYIRIDVHDNTTGENASYTKTIHYGTPPPKVIVADGENTLPINFSIEQNYPNPFNPTTQITYAISYDANISINVYDVLGRKVSELVNEQQTAGFHTVNFNASNLSSGIYFYRITAIQGGNILYSETKRMLLMK